MSERILVKDLPIWASDDLIKECISSQVQIKSNGFVYKSKARNNITSGSSCFDNGDRYFYKLTPCQVNVLRTQKIDR